VTVLPQPAALYAATYSVLPVVVVVVVDDEALVVPLPQPSARVRKETAAASANRECRRVKVYRVL
jgi:hypothetical protein